MAKKADKKQSTKEKPKKVEKEVKPLKPKLKDFKISTIVAYAS